VEWRDRQIPNIRRLSLGSELFSGKYPDSPHSLFLFIPAAAGVLSALMLCCWTVSTFRYLVANAATDTVLIKALALELITRVLVAVFLSIWATSDMYKTFIWWALLAGLL
jgi:hypothetical protein